MLIYDEELQYVWPSSYLQKLRSERDKANGVPVHQLSSRYADGEAAVRHHFDPCQRGLVSDSVYNREAHEQRFTAMLDEERQALEEESACRASGLGRLPHTFDNKGRYRFFAAVMEREAAALGFHYDKPKSRPNYPVFSKPMSDEWDLCWAIEEARAFFHSPFEGHFSPYLEIRGRTFRGSVAKGKSGEFLHIRYASVVPGFSNGYWTFFDLDQLETAIMAHLHLYSLMASVIEGGIKTVLAPPPA
jgi:hypothetical protein